MYEVYSPREDSYLMKDALEKTIKDRREKRKVKLLEIGCGSGVLLNSAHESGIKKENIFSVDINQTAVEKCKNLGFNSKKSDLFEKVKGKFDIIIFNPPYLPEDKKEPKSSRISTTGGNKGSELINRFLKESKDYLKENGKILLLNSSLTKGINWQDYKKEIIDSKKLFMEELYVWKLSR